MDSITAEHKKRRTLGVYFTLLFLVLIWLVKIAEVVFEFDLTVYGIRPRELKGLIGVFTSGILHADFVHLTSNTIAMLVVGPMLYYFYRPVAFKMFGYAYILTGMLTWIIAGGGNHIGSSGVIYSVFGFLLVSGFIRRHYGLIAVGFIMLMLHSTFSGSLLLTFIPEFNPPNVSWEGHLAGFLIGVVLAFGFRKEGPQRKVYEWNEEDEEDELHPDDPNNPNNQSKVQVQYHIKKD